MNPVEIEYARPPAAIQEALRVLGIRRLLLGIQDPAFPCHSEEDIGRGSPYAEGARQFMAFARSLGFNGLQLGPQGMTSLANASPYDGTLFSRNQLSLAPLPLTKISGDELFSQKLLADLVQERPQGTQTRTSHVYAYQAQKRISEEVWSRYQVKLADGSGAELASAFALFRKKNGGWLTRDGLYEALRNYYGDKNWRFWRGGREVSLDRHLWHPVPGDEKKTARRRRLLFKEFQHEISAYAFTQFLLHRQHQELRDYAHDLGLELFGDMQIGFSGRDAWFADSFLLQGYVMGAPPSRTNPEGQPWNYPLLDPKRYFADTVGQ
ncbi:MAG: 4-alpha-glucanotransferase, partial [Desulfobulbaceae bacterium]|nr:4-alpha-glucanotransferase [Desulfobulbaceae bacterium]